MKIGMIIHIFPRSTPQYNREKLLRAGLLIHGVPNNANAPNFWVTMWTTVLLRQWNFCF